MAMLSTGVPDWTIELGQVAGLAIERMIVEHHELSGVYLYPEVMASDVLVASAVKVTGLRREAVWVVGFELAEWWPGWLTRADVDLRIRFPGFVARAPAWLMDDLASGAVNKPRWLRSLVVEKGLLG